MTSRLKCCARYITRLSFHVYICYNTHMGTQKDVQAHQAAAQFRDALEQCGYSNACVFWHGEEGQSIKAGGSFPKEIHTLTIVGILENIKSHVFTKLKQNRKPWDSD